MGSIVIDRLTRKSISLEHRMDLSISMSKMENRRMGHEIP